MSKVRAFLLSDGVTLLVPVDTLCRTCNGDKFICDVSSPPRGCGADYCAANRRPCHACVTTSTSTRPYR